MKTTKKGVARLLVFAVFLALVLYTASWGFGTEGAGSIYDIEKGLDLAGGVSITYTTVGDEEPSEQDLKDTIYRLQKRVESYSTEAAVYAEGSDRIVVDIPGATDANAILEELGEPGTLYFIVASSYQEALDSAGVSYTQYTGSSDGAFSASNPGLVVMDGNMIKNASGAVYQSQSATGGYEYVVSLTLKEEGQSVFSKVTSLLVEDKGIIYVVYNNEVVSSPRVNVAITGDSCQIEGMESLEEAEQLASTIRIGALPLELEELRSTVVGATLGSNAVTTSLIAGAIGFVLVVILMILLYSVMGLVASLALTAYVGVIIVLLSAFEVTLTLPGIAGIILGIGMAVDANVIIYERIREEIAQGKTVLSAIKTGFSKALSAIVDGNITTLIAAFVLYFMGSGTVKGFAQTLALGIVVSMFTALVITRFLMYALYYVGLKSESLYTRGIIGGKKKSEKKVVNFLSKKNICFAVSSLVIVAGLVVMVISGLKGNALNYSIDFIGGTSMTATLQEAKTVEELEGDMTSDVAEAAGLSTSDVTISPVQGSTDVIIKTKELSVEQRDAVYTVLEEKYQVNTAAIEAQNISATVSSEMRTDAVVAVIVSTICMMLYILIRFKDIRFAAGAVVPLIHDVLVVLTFYAIFRWSVGNTFIACMLTIVGYSINATIVIFDRIRENLSLMEKNTLEEVVNTSISETLTRSIYTSLTTVIMVVVLFIMGVTAIREFALPLIVGIVCGGYSSVCIAGAIWYVLKVKFAGKKADA